MKTLAEITAALRALYPDAMSVKIIVSYREQSATAGRFDIAWGQQAK